MFTSGSSNSPNFQYKFHLLSLSLDDGKKLNTHCSTGSAYWSHQFLCGASFSGVRFGHNSYSMDPPRSRAQVLNFRIRTNAPIRNAGLTTAPTRVGTGDAYTYIFTRRPACSSVSISLRSIRALISHTYEPKGGYNTPNQRRNIRSCVRFDTTSANPPSFQRKRVATLKKAHTQVAGGPWTFIYRQNRF